MDDKTKNTTISAPAGVAKTNIPENKKSNGLKAQLPIIIAIVILLIGIGVALFFILRKPAEKPAPYEEEGVEVVYEPSEGTTDPSTEYVEKMQTIIDDPETSFEDRLSAQISIANFYSDSGQTDRAEELLNSIDRESLTNLQRNHLYNAYVELYKEKGDNASRNEYADLAEEALRDYWGEPSPEETEESEASAEE